MFCIHDICNAFPKYPNYWLCQGDTLQIALDRKGMIKEHFPGGLPALLEISGEKVYQAISPIMSGSFELCSQTTTHIRFQHPKCQNIESSQNIRLGLLNISTGQLFFRETKAISNKVIISMGDFECRHLGNHFNFGMFNYVTKK